MNTPMIKLSHEAILAVLAGGALFGCQQSGTEQAKPEPPGASATASALVQPAETAPISNPSEAKSAEQQSELAKPEASSGLKPGGESHSGKTAGSAPAEGAKKTDGSPNAQGAEKPAVSAKEIEQPAPAGSGAESGCAPGRCGPGQCG